MTHLWLKYEPGDDNVAKTSVVGYKYLAVNAVYWKACHTVR